MVTPNDVEDTWLASALHSHNECVIQNDVTSDSMTSGIGPINLGTDKRSPLGIDQNLNGHV